MPPSRLIVAALLFVVCGFSHSLPMRGQETLPTKSSAAGPYATATTLTASGSQGSYQLNATVIASGPGKPTGTVTFTDVTTNTTLGTSPAGAIHTTFNASLSIYFPDGASDAALGDLNGDGNEDMVVIDGDAIMVVLGAGDGTFASPALVTSAVPNTGGQSVALADLNGDGKLDILVGSNNVNALAVFLGHGDGTFGGEKDYPLAGYAGSLAVADFNGDGKPDIATANYLTSGSMSVLLGKGDGTFQTEHAYTTSTASQSVTVGDYNGDGKMDVAVSNGDGTISIFLGHGDGTFAAQPLFKGSSSTINPGPRGIATGDLDGDGKLDLVLANVNSKAVGVFFGNGNGTFQAVQQFPIDLAYPSGVIVTDLNGDGKPDVAVSSSPQGDTAVLLSNGNRTFQTAMYHFESCCFVSLAVGDLNGDSIPDIAALGDGEVDVFFGQNAFTSSLTRVSLPGSGNQTVSAKYSGDTHFLGSSSNTLTLPTMSQVAATPTFSPAGGAYTDEQYVVVGDTTPGVTIYYTIDGSTPSAANAKYNSPFRVGSPRTLKAIAVATGYANSAVASATYIFPVVTPTITLASGAYKMPASTTITAYNATHLFYCTSTSGNCTPGTAYTSAVTINASPTEYLCAFGTAAGYTQSATVCHVYTKAAPAATPTFTTLTASGSQGSYQLNAAVIASGAGTPTGTVTFTDVTTNTTLGTAPAGASTTTFTTGSPIDEPTTANDVAIGDVNGDGIKDMVVSGDIGIAVALGHGDGTFAPPTSLAAGTNYGGPAIALVDLNRDGKLDIVAAGMNASGVAVFLGNGDGTFGAVNFYPLGTYLHSLTAADFNGDGKLDIATANSNATGASMSILLGKGDGTFQTAHDYPTDQQSLSVTVGDYNGDGKMDAAVINQAGTISLFLGKGDGTFGTQTLVSTPSTDFYSGPRGIAAGDLNGDGKLDLVFANGNSPAIGILYGNGNGTFQAVQQFPISNGMPDGVVVADIDGDGKPDIAVSNGGYGAPILLNNGNHTFRTVYYGPGLSNSLAVADLNSDGILDVVLATGPAVDVLLGQTAFTTSLAHLSLPGSGSQTVSAKYSGDTHFAGSTSNTLTLPTKSSVAATPTFSSANYPGEILVTLADATAGATIYYTTNGTAPTTASTKFDSAFPINVSATEKIEAIAVATGYTNSAIAAATYTIK